MTFTGAEQLISDQAIVFARKNKKAIAKRLTDKSVYLSERRPVSVFMAGSPGAGKTEASIELLDSIAADVSIIRIDPDELRSELPGYKGGNSYLFQPAVSILVDKIHDLALSQNQSFLLDGTLSRFEIADKNIKRSIDKGRLVQILYVYQDPLLAWQFVTSRELDEGRKILSEHFVDQYFSARETVDKVKQDYGADVRVDVLMKNIDNTHRSYKANVDLIGNHVSEKYTRESLSHSLAHESN